MLDTKNTISGKSTLKQQRINESISPSINYVNYHICNYFLNLTSQSNIPLLSSFIKQTYTVLTEKWSEHILHEHKKVIIVPWKLYAVKSE